MSMIRVAVGDQHFRTKSIDRVARRLYGPKARAVVQESRDGRIFGLLVTPDRNNPSILVVRERFAQEPDPVERASTSTTSKKSAIPSRKPRVVRVVTDDEGHKVSIYE